ncbi:uncharacterized protein LOC111387469 [Olea europaea var. sylvestris]|uniref:Uncharacterized protein n=1 Tax=Olea europaea subsp. europaea TaxID=158383 RepID=A0A8S0T9X4_OLEEU|nr:uncharacterized protein LOC111387469 [Olea europaea var. sylvestris]CAA3001862.1 Hypothetical predicted protein [Olea europaea subsp. europaea]
MHTISTFKFITVSSTLSSSNPRISTALPLFSKKFSSGIQNLSSISTSRKTLFQSKSSEEAEVSEAEDEWLQRLPEKKKPIYAHSLPCIEAWLRSLGFYQSREDRAAWFVEKPDWHAKLSLDVTDLCIRYLKSGPGELEKDVERRFSYALSREDIENAILGGP